jgi:hypothetical protein
LLTQRKMGFTKGNLRHGAGGLMLDLRGQSATLCAQRFSELDFVGRAFILHYIM